ncbi:DsbA family oxidoreductase [Paenibacillus sp. Soil787]|uniref:DsbA family oxidoreductase n=1 Tax=Paenibacillus sp. Soil787 TaxID=1736411 RepID=UPI0006FF3CA9|nr:DsbA family oxidoreductase [Paenibacillus sp. Soil787]KRF42908.1 protein-disulfide isomerase [Paenibacillus sp. Soil787]
MKVEVWSDFACPFCYIGKQRLEAAIDQFAHRDDVEVVFRSFELDPNAQRDVSYDVHDMLAAKYGMSREQAIAMNENLGNQAKEVGLAFQFDTMILTNTFDAHRLALYASKQGKMNPMTQELFRAYFTDSRHLGDHETLTEIAVKAGLDRDEALKVLTGTDYSAEVRADEEASRLGARGVPFFVIDRKHAVSGAQSTNMFLHALQTAWNESQPPTVQNDSGSESAPAACDDGVCAPSVKRKS